jgi:branched-chain amino acid transport system permease protein
VTEKNNSNSRIFAVARAFAVVVGALIMFSAPGVANAADSENSIIVSVQDQANNNGVSEKKPVTGVKVSVSNSAGLAIGEGVTDSAGLATIPVPAKDDYVVTLDVASLPTGVTLVEGTKTVVNIVKDSFTTNSKRVTFFAGSVGESGASLFDRVAQRLVDGIRLGLIIAICSVGLSLIFGTTGLTNFAHGEMVTFGGLIAFWFNVLLGIPLLIAAPLVIALGGVLGLAMNGIIFAKLRKRGIGLISQLVVSVGLSIMLRNMYLYQFGGRTRPLDDFSLQVAKSFGPVSITMRDLTTAIISLVVLLGVAAFLQRSRTGKAIRAVSDNPSLASSTGIDTQKIIRVVWFAGGALAAMGGV